MTSFQGESEIEVVGIYNDVGILLRIGYIVCTNHGDFHIGLAVVLVGDECCTLGHAHCLQPCAPVAVVFRHLGKVTIALLACVASSPAPVVGTQHGILCSLVLTTQNDDKVFPVAVSTIVDELQLIGHTRFCLNVFCKDGPESCRIVCRTQLRGSWRNFNNVQHLLREFLVCQPVRGRYLIEVSTFTTHHCQHAYCRQAEGCCSFYKMFHIILY